MGAVGRTAGDDRVARDPRGAADGKLTVTFVAHFWRADFLRVFGRDFFASLLEHQVRGGRLAIEGRKLLHFTEGETYRRTAPVLGYAWNRGGLYAIKVDYFDTGLAFGYGKLDELARTLVGVGKLEGFGEGEKEDMLATFSCEPERAYAYAVQDAVLTLLVKERMDAAHREMYDQLGLGEDVPPLRSTQGSWVAEIIVRSVVRDAVGSAELSSKGGDVSLRKVKKLLRKGSGKYLAEVARSRFGEQTGQTHGGLLFSRSPTVFFHGATGMLRDVDLFGCYARVMSAVSLYAGRPVVYEPGTDGAADRMTLKEAVAFLEQHAAGRDAWIVKVSGKIGAGPNALIPSTKSALTNANHKKRAAQKWAKAASAQYGFAFDRAAEDDEDGGNTAIYTDVVEAGVVAWPTWLMIRALPAAWRAEYEALEVDTILFYPRQRVAGDGPGYDALVKEHSHDGTAWRERMEMEEPVRKLAEELVDDEYVALRFDLGKLARAMQERREEAKEQHGKGPPAEKGWKTAVNMLYGVMACAHLPTNNVVAANVITATARALAFAMQMSLNGIQVITDGCSYRADQVPAGTLADCLRACPDYPINRAGFRGPFLDAAEVPEDDAAFTAWYRRHVKRFFGVSGPAYDRLFGLHHLEHKRCGEPERASFDGLCCDGSGNSVKAFQAGADWKAADVKARSFKEKAKKTLEPWIIKTYTEDRYAGPPPIAEAPSLLSYKAAGWPVGR